MVGYQERGEGAQLASYYFFTVLACALAGAAGYSVLAHLEYLVSRGIVATDGDPVIGGSYRLANRE